MMKQKTIFSLFGLLLLIAGAGAGVLLVQQTQELREKAQACSLIDESCTNSNDCCSKNCISDPSDNPIISKICYCSHAGGSCATAEDCCESNLVCNDAVCKAEGCSSSSDQKCKDKNVGDECDTDKTCSKGGGGMDGKPVCNCTSEGGGGGGTKSPTPKPSGGGKKTPKPTPQNCKANKNPSQFGPIKGSGNLIIHGRIYPAETADFKIALKKNTTSCSLDDKDVLVEKTLTKTPLRIDTGLAVTSSDKICVFVQYTTTSGTEKGNGWKEAKDNKCGGGDYTEVDISPLTDAAKKDGEVTSSQCWLDQGPECDFNDFVLVFVAGKGGAETGNGVKLRFQGITKKAADQAISASFSQNGSVVWQTSETLVTNDSTGAYNLPVPTSVVAGTYNFRAKGHSHLQKLFSNLVYNGTGVDLAGSENYQLRAGDVTDDNTITIADVAQVSSYFTDFSIPVNISDSKMKASDINKDGKITIQDLALIAINWSDFSVPGDQ